MYVFEISEKAMKEITNALDEAKCPDYSAESAVEAHQRIDNLVTAFSRLLAEAERALS
jgi:hypothetical protein